MKVAVVQMNSTPDVPANVAKACGWIDRAAAEYDAELVVLPEFFNTIYFAQYRDARHYALAEVESGPTMTEIRECARRNGTNVIATIYEAAGPGLYFDTAMHIDGAGEIRFKYRKVHPSAVLSLEKIYFRYGTRFATFRLGEWRTGIGICYDMAFPETARSLMVNGAELLVTPYATSRIAMFQEMLRTRAFENGCFLAAANKVGRDGDWVFGGGSLIVDPTGVILAAADTSTEMIVAADITHEAVVAARIRFPTRRDRRPDLYRSLVAEVDEIT